jgi:transposase
MEGDIMEIMYPRCAGLDGHKKTVVACRMRTGETGEVDYETQTFGTKTSEL